MYQTVLKDLFCDQDDREVLFFLQSRNRQMLEKKLTDLNCDELCTLLRHERIPKPIVRLTLSRLKEDPTAGWSYPGELLSALNEVEPSFIREYGGTILLIVAKARAVTSKRHWENEEAAEAFGTVLDQLEEKVRKKSAGICRIPEHPQEPSKK